MAHHEDKGVHWFLRGVKTKWAEPGGDKLANYLMNHPWMRKLLAKVDPEWLKTIGSGVEFAAGPLEIPGKGSVAYIINEAADSFMKGIGRNLKKYEEMTPEDIANDLEVIAATSLAIKALEEAKVKVDLIENAFHAADCMRAKGKPIPLLDAVKQGAVPKNCICIGPVLNGFQEVLSTKTEPPAKVEPLTIIELMDEIEKEAVETNSPLLLGSITRFNAAFFDLSPELRLKFEYLAKEKRAKEKLKLLISKSEKDWEACIDAMLDDPMQVKADGVIKRVTEGFGKLASGTVGLVKEERKKFGELTTDGNKALRQKKAELDLRYAEQIKARSFKKKFRAHRNRNRGWFTYLVYGSFFFTVSSIVYYAVTH